MPVRTRTRRNFFLRPSSSGDPVAPCRVVELATCRVAGSGRSPERRIDDSPCRRSDDVVDLLFFCRKWIPKLLARARWAQTDVQVGEGAGKLALGARATRFATLNVPQGAFALILYREKLPGPMRDAADLWQEIS